MTMVQCDDDDDDDDDCGDMPLGEWWNRVLHRMNVV